MSLYDIFPVKEVSGDIVTFEDGADGIPMESLSAVITPTQDLNGYDNPWPGGGGDNKFEPFSGTYNGATFTVQDDGTVKITGNATAATWTSVNRYVDLPWNGINAGDTVVLWSDIYAVVGSYEGSTLIRNKSSQNGVETSYTIPSNATRLRFYEYAKATVPSAGEVFDVIGHYYFAKANSFSSWRPYANICPISGLTGLSVYVSPTQDPDNATVYNVDLSTQAGTVYGGTLDVVTGVLTVDMANIPSYNGETINEPWLSSMDAYVAGATPTTGAQVVYTLATPLMYQLTPQEVTTLLGLNNVWADVVPVSVKYHSQTQSGGKRIDGLFVDGIDMQANGWFLKWRKLAAPKPKTNYVSVWGRDGDIDLTESGADGQVFYENRDLMMDMVYIGDDWTDAYSELLDNLHGKDCMVQFSSDPYWYWAGRIIASLYEHKPHSLSMNGTVFPYKLSIKKTKASATVSGATEETATEVVLPGSRMRVSPKVTVTTESGQSVTLKWGTKTQSLSAGVYYVRGLKVGSEDVTIKVYGTGTVNFEYRKGML